MPGWTKYGVTRSEYQGETGYGRIDTEQESLHSPGCRGFDARVEGATYCRTPKQLSLVQDVARMSPGGG